MKTVPSNLYNDQYYLGQNGCEGVEVFLNTKGQSLSNRLAIVFNEIKDFKDKRILELGSGRGEIALHLESQAKSMLCVDYSQSACNIAASILKKSRVHCADAVEFLPTLNEEFDIILMNDFLEHLYGEQVEIIFQQVPRLTVQGGLLYINTPIIPSRPQSVMHVNIQPSVESIQRYLPDFELIKNMISDPAGSDYLLIFRKR